MENIAIIGAGNLGLSIAKGITAKGLREPGQLYLTKKKPNAIRHWREQGYTVTANNREAVARAPLIFLCVQPKQLPALLREIDPALRDNHILISVITGVSIAGIQSTLSARCEIIRAMPNTAIAIGKSMTCLCGNAGRSQNLERVAEIFRALGDVMVIEEKMMKAATVLGASGIAFFMRYLRAATQGGIEMGFHAKEAQNIAVQTARGAAELIIAHQNHPEVEIDSVTTPQGCTIAGLNEMEHQGLSSALIKGLLTSFEKINSMPS